MNSTAISSLNKLSEIFDDDFLVIVKDNHMYKILFSDFKLSANNFFTVPEIFNKITEDLYLLKNRTLRRVTAVESLLDDSDFKVNTNVYFIGDDSDNYDDPRFFIYNKAADAFVPLDGIDHINPAWFDIRPDGDDNSDALQNVINFASFLNEGAVRLMNSNYSVTQKPLIFGPGTYNINQSITIPSNIHIKGGGAQFQFDKSVITGIIVTGDNVTLENVEFSTTQSHLYACSCNNLRILDCEFNSGKTGIYMNSVSASNISQNTFNDNDTVGMRFDRTTDTIIDNNIFKNSNLVEGSWNDNNSHGSNVVTSESIYCTNPQSNNSIKTYTAKTKLETVDFDDYFFAISGYGNFDVSLESILGDEWFDPKSTSFKVHTDVFYLSPRATPDLINLYTSHMANGTSTMSWREGDGGTAVKAFHMDYCRYYKSRTLLTGRNHQGYDKAGWAQYGDSEFPSANSNVMMIGDGWDFGALDIEYNINDVFGSADNSNLQDIFNRSTSDQFSKEIRIDKDTMISNYKSLHEHVDDKHSMISSHVSRFGEQLYYDDYSRIHVEYYCLYNCRPYRYKHTTGWLNAGNDQYSKFAVRGKAVGNTLSAKEDLDPNITNISLFGDTLFYDGKGSGYDWRKFENGDYASLMPEVIYNSKSSEPASSTWKTAKFNPVILDVNLDSKTLSMVLAEPEESILPRDVPAPLQDTPAFQTSGQRELLFYNAFRLEDLQEISDTPVLRDVYKDYSSAYTIQSRPFMKGWNEALIQLPWIDLDITKYTVSYPHEEDNNRNVGPCQPGPHHGADDSTGRQYWFTWFGFDGSDVGGDGRASVMPMIMDIKNKNKKPSPFANSVRRGITWMAPLQDTHKIYHHYKNQNNKSEMPSVYHDSYFTGAYVYYDKGLKDLFFSANSIQLHRHSTSNKRIRPHDTKLNNFKDRPLWGSGGAGKAWVIPDEGLTGALWGSDEEEEFSHSAKIQDGNGSNKEIDALYNIQEDDARPYDKQLTVMFVGIRRYGSDGRYVNRSRAMQHHVRRHDLDSLHTSDESIGTYYTVPEGLPEHSVFIDSLNFDNSYSCTLSAINDVINDLNLYDGCINLDNIYVPPIIPEEVDDPVIEEWDPEPEPEPEPEIVKWSTGWQHPRINGEDSWFDRKTKGNRTISNSTYAKEGYQGDGQACRTYTEIYGREQVKMMTGEQVMLEKYWTNPDKYSGANPTGRAEAMRQNGLRYVMYFNPDKKNEHLIWDLEERAPVSEIHEDYWSFEVINDNLTRAKFGYENESEGESAAVGPTLFADPWTTYGQKHFLTEVQDIYESCYWDTGVFVHNLGTTDIFSKNIKVWVESFDGVQMEIGVNNFEVIDENTIKITNNLFHYIGGGSEDSTSSFYDIGTYRTIHASTRKVESNYFGTKEYSGTGMLYHQDGCSGPLDMSASMSSFWSGTDIIGRYWKNSSGYYSLHLPHIRESWMRRWMVEIELGPSAEELAEDPYSEEEVVPDSCGTGEIWDWTLGKCRTVCDVGYTYNYATYKCVPLP